ncbi:arsenate reductase (glutaredoxin) [Pseudomonas sp. TMP9]|uniref:arsenate reductase (glutaredoxin) n=1 Tax=Pseudomonas sp. TMP9 TaxID=3133144 RepID=UPI0030D4272F
MTAMTLYHNPRCSKSRNALHLLQERGFSPTIVRYLETPLNAVQLQTLLSTLGLNVRQLLRTGEDDYKALGLSNLQLTDEQLFDALLSQPKLLERPILVVGDKAVIGRPPETILEILP